MNLNRCVRCPLHSVIVTVPDGKVLTSSRTRCQLPRGHANPQRMEEKALLSTLTVPGTIPCAPFMTAREILRHSLDADLDSW